MLKKLFRLKQAVASRPLLAYSLLLIAGVLAAAVIVLPTLESSPDRLITTHYMSCRVERLQEMIDQLNAGGPAVINSVPDHNAGYYLYLSHLGALLGKDAVGVFVWIQTAALLVVMALYPAMFYKLSGSFLAALASPFLLGHLQYDLMLSSKTDSYWVLSWALAICIPLLLMFYREKKQWLRWLLFAALCFLISFSNLPRLHASLSIFLLLGAMLVWQELIQPCFREKQGHTARRAAKTVALAAVLLVSYSFLSTTFPKIYLRMTGQNPDMEPKGPWHTIYIGVGWQENPFGIEYSDLVGLHLMEEKCPNVVYNSKEYIDFMKEEYFDLFRQEPDFMVRSYVEKALECVRVIWEHFAPQAALYLTAAALMLALALWRRHQKRSGWVPGLSGVLLSLFCCGVDVVFPMMAIPAGAYNYGTLGGFAIALLFLYLGLAQAGLEAVERAALGQGQP